MSAIAFPIAAFMQCLVLLLASITAVAIVDLTAVPHPAWISPDRSAQLDLFGGWRLAEKGRNASVRMTPDGTIVLDGWPRDVVCPEG